MMKKYLIALLFPVLMLIVACGDDINPKRPVVDQPGVLFIENGRRDTLPTDISPEQLKQALLDNAWEFSYSFFYDDYKIGNRGEDGYVSRFRYTFGADGTAVATDLTDGKTYTYSYTLTARTVTLKSASATLSFGVLGMDKHHMICDESLAGQVAPGYDSSSLTRRMIFLARK